MRNASILELIAYEFGVSPFDPPTLAVVALGFFIITLVACYLAARRVTSIDPDRLLRDGG